MFIINFLKTKLTKFFASKPNDEFVGDYEAIDESIADGFLWGMIIAIIFSQTLIILLN